MRKKILEFRLEFNVVCVGVGVCVCVCVCVRERERERERENNLLRLAQMIKSHLANTLKVIFC